MNRCPLTLDEEYLRQYRHQSQKNRVETEIRRRQLVVSSNALPCVISLFQYCVGCVNNDMQMGCAGASAMVGYCVSMRVLTELSQEDGPDHQVVLNQSPSNSFFVTSCALNALSTIALSTSTFDAGACNCCIAVGINGAVYASYTAIESLKNAKIAYTLYAHEERKKNIKTDMSIAKITAQIAFPRTTLDNRGKKHVIPALPDHIAGLIAQFAVESLPKLNEHPETKEERDENILTQKINKKLLDYTGRATVKFVEILENRKKMTPNEKTPISQYKNNYGSTGAFKCSNFEMHKKEWMER